MSEDLDLSISISSYTPEALGREVADELRTQGLRTDVGQRGQEVFAPAFGWIIPSAIIIFVSNKFFGTILEEAAKDTYKAVKAVVLRFIKKTCGKHRSFDPKIVTASREAKDPYSNFSIVATTRSGRQVVFPFQLNQASHSYEVSLGQVFELMNEHLSESSGDRLTVALEKISHDPSRTIYMRFDKASEQWVAIDWMEEARKASSESESSGDEAAKLPKGR